jgi:hypothetical protein
MQMRIKTLRLKKGTTQQPLVLVQMVPKIAPGLVNI